MNPISRFMAGMLCAFAMLLAGNAAAQTFATLYNFQGGSNGGVPIFNLSYHSGMIYGATYSGAGSVFSFDLAGDTESVIHQFAGSTSDGSLPSGPAIYHFGKLYGATATGGAYDKGVIYQIDLATGLTAVLYSFSGGLDGAAPSGSLVYRQGALYGTASEGGGSALGTIFKMNLYTKKLQTVHSFSGGSDGAMPQAGLVYHRGFLYGTTMHGGPADKGTVYSVDLTSGSETVVYAFQGGADGEYPE